MTEIDLDANGLNAFLKVLCDNGITIHSPNDGDLDDLEAERFRAVCDAIRAYINALPKGDNAELVERLLEVKSKADDAISSADGGPSQGLAALSNYGEIALNLLPRAAEALERMPVVSVPLEPTDEMIAAGLEVLSQEGHSVIDRDPLFFWRAMHHAFTSHLSQTTPVSEISEGDWPEDFPHENGNYQNKCSDCGKLFLGHKSRVICKKCSKVPTVEELNSETTTPDVEPVAWRVSPLGINPLRVKGEWDYFNFEPVGSEFHKKEPLFSPETVARLQSERDRTYEYACNFLGSFTKNLIDPLITVEPLPDTLGVLTQIDHTTKVIAVEFRKRAEAAEAMLKTIEDETIERCAQLVERGFDKEVSVPCRNDGVYSKNDKCPHDLYMYEDCEQCAVVAIRSLKEEEEKG